LLRVAESLRFYLYFGFTGTEEEEEEEEEELCR